MSAVIKRSDLVVSLASVAIAALAGPLGTVGVETARQLVKVTESAWSQGSSQRELRDAVRAGVAAWAAGEGIDPDVVDRGLGWAIEYVQQAGSTYDLAAKEGFDAIRVTNAVVKGVRRSDRYWGSDTEYAVAERALRATYDLLCSRMKRDGGAVLAAVEQTRQAISSEIDRLRYGLLGVADRDALIRYLNSKMRDWDYSPWTQGNAPSALERAIRLDVAGDSRQLVSPEEALNDARLLAVLGGPGSGKTWLAQRFARETAKAALTQLQDPRVDPGAVEIPMLTTWSAWAHQRGDGVEALAAAALPSPEADHVRRAVLQPGARVLAVIDSLDEVGVGDHTSRILLHSLVVPPAWRVIVTSRPEAWHTNASAQPALHMFQIGTILDLDYPTDVHGFIVQWFNDEPSYGQNLIDQIDHRLELRITARVPLLLTFYCMLTEQEPEERLPWRHRDLYRGIVDRLLRGGWSSDQTEPDLAACRETLQSWAWSAVKEANTPAGLSAWPDTIITPRAPTTLDRALDNVAPKQKYPKNSKYDHARVERHFLHRTLFEHCVAEHIATLTPEEAVDALLPHLWFDSDWAVVSQSALAGHPDRNAVLDGLWRHHPHPTTELQRVANEQIEEILIQVASMTLPSDWNLAHQALIIGLLAERKYRTELTSTYLNWTLVDRKAAAEALASALADDRSGRSAKRTLHELSALAAGREADRLIVRQAILAVLPRALPLPAVRLVKLLSELAPTHDDRVVARDCVLSMLSRADDPLIYRFALDLADVLLLLDLSDADRLVARKTVLATLKSANPGMVPALAELLSKLNPTAKERVEARAVILASVRYYSLGRLSATLIRLQRSEADLLAARAAVLAAARIADALGVLLFIELLLGLQPTDEDRHLARDAILGALPTAGPSAVAPLVEVLSRLDPTTSDVEVARRKILGVLSVAHPMAVVPLAAAFSLLDPTDQERRTARDAVFARLLDPDPAMFGVVAGQFLLPDTAHAARTIMHDAILESLPTAETWVVGRLGEFLPNLAVVTVTDRDLVRDVIVKALPDLAPHTVASLAYVLTLLKPSDEDLASARQAVLSALPDSDPVGALDRLVAVLPLLEPTDQDRVVARDAVLAALLNAKKWTVTSLAVLLSEHQLTDDDKNLVRQAILIAIPQVGPEVVAGLVEVLLGLGVEDADRTLVWKAICAALPTADEVVAIGLFEVASEFMVSDPDRAIVRSAVLAALPATRADLVERLIAVLFRLGPSRQDRVITRDALVAMTKAAPPTANRIVELIRQCASPADWLDLLR